jgi:hypothetical protein
MNQTNKRSSNLDSTHIVNSSPKSNLPEFNDQNSNNFTGPDGKFDVIAFNKAYDKHHNKAITIAKAEDAARLALLNQEITIVQPYNKNIYQLLIGIKDTLFGIIDDILLFNYKNILIRENRLFYIGLTILIIVICIYIFDLLLDNKSADDNKKNEQPMYVIKYIYENKKNIDSHIPAEIINDS